MILKVLKYNKQEDYHWCEDEQGNKHRIDICVDGGLKDLANDRESLEGISIECDFIHAYISIANGVRLLKANSH